MTRGADRPRQLPIEPRCELSSGPSSAAAWWRHGTVLMQSSGGCDGPRLTPEANGFGRRRVSRCRGVRTAIGAKAGGQMSGLHPDRAVRLTPGIGRERRDQPCDPLQWLGLVRDPPLRRGATARPLGAPLRSGPMVLRRASGVAIKRLRRAWERQPGLGGSESLSPEASANPARPPAGLDFSAHVGLTNPQASRQKLPPLDSGGSTGIQR